jgi:hypothetical protein
MDLEVVPLRLVQAAEGLGAEEALATSVVTLNDLDFVVCSIKWGPML